MLKKCLYHQRNEGRDRVFLLVQKPYNMKKCNLTFNSRLSIGDLYLFHPSNKNCPYRSSLWGIYDKTEDSIIYLESSTLNLIHFKKCHPLPKYYCYYRLATRSELRDYMYNMGVSDGERK